MTVVMPLDVVVRRIQVGATILLCVSGTENGVWRWSHGVPCHTCSWHLTCRPRVCQAIRWSTALHCMRSRRLLMRRSVPGSRPMLAVAPIASSVGGCCADSRPPLALCASPALQGLGAFYRGMLTTYLKTAPSKAMLLAEGPVDVLLL